MRFEQLNFDFTETPPTVNDWRPLRDAFMSMDQMPQLTASLDFHKSHFFQGPKFGLHVLRYIIGYQNDKVIGIMPLYFVGDDPETELWEFIGALTYCSYTPPCPPQHFTEFLPQLPPLFDEHVDNDYWKATGLQVHATQSGDFLLPATFDAYIAGASAKDRSKFRANLRRNEDLRVEVRTDVDRELVNQLLPAYQDYWKAREDESYVDTSLKIAHDIEMFYGHPEQLVAIYVYDAAGIIAINFAWRAHKMIDMLCLRRLDDDSKKRGLGIFCVLKNIEAAINFGITKYTMAAGDQAYKKQFAYDLVPNQGSVLNGSIIDLLQGKRDFYYQGEFMADDVAYAKALDSVPEVVVDELCKKLVWLATFAEFQQKVVTPFKESKLESIDA